MKQRPGRAGRARLTSWGQVSMLPLTTLVLIAFLILMKLLWQMAVVVCVDTQERDSLLASEGLQDEALSRQI